MTMVSDLYHTTTENEIYFTADVRQPWTNYVNNGNKHLIVGADVRSEYSNNSIFTFDYW